MPYFTDKMKLGPSLSRRIKLDPIHKDIIRHMYKHGNKIAHIARWFQVSRRTIQFVLFPERRAKNVSDLKKRGGSKLYYNKEAQRKYKKEYRKRKYNLFKHLKKHK